MNQLPQSLVIFDCDGVLVDSEIISVEVDQKVLADLGWSISVDEIIDRFVGRSHAHFLEAVEDHLGRKLPDDWENSYQPLFREASLRDLLPVEGIFKALKGSLLLISSSTPRLHSASSLPNAWSLKIVGQESPQHLQRI